MVDTSIVSGYYDGLDHKLRDQPGRTHNGVNLGLNFLFLFLIFNLTGG